MTLLFILVFGTIVGIPVLAAALWYGERLARRDERMGIYDGPRPRYISEPLEGPYAYDEGDTVQPANGGTEYFTVLYIRRHPLKNTKVTVRNNRTGETRTANRTAWKKAKLSW